MQHTCFVWKCVRKTPFTAEILVPKSIIDLCKVTQLKAAIVSVVCKKTHRNKIKTKLKVHLTLQDGYYKPIQVWT